MKLILLVLLFIILVFLLNCFYFVDRNHDIFIFYSKNCKYSKLLFNNYWTNIKNVLILKNLKFILIDGDNNTKYLKKYNITVYPTILKKTNNKYIQYDGKIELESILSFIND